MRWKWWLAVMVVFLAAAIGCSDSSSNNPGRLDESDDDGGPPLPDDDADDDDNNDTGADDDDDNDTGVDDDSSPDDDDDDNDDDDDDDDNNDDNDNNDDDTSPPPEPYVEILLPTEGQTFTSPDVPVNIAIQDVTDWTVTLDGVVVNNQLVAGPTSITGELNGVVTGDHTLEVNVAKAATATYDVVHFDVDLGGTPYLDLTLSAASAQLGDEVTRTVVVIDEGGNDITDQVEIDYIVEPGSGFLQNGDVFVFEQPGTYVFTATCEYAGKVTLADQETHVAYDHIPTTITLNLSSYNITAGAYVIANYAVFNQFDELIPGFPVELNVNPGTGVTVNGNKITFTTTGLFTVTVNPLDYPAVTASRDVTVRPGTPAYLHLTLTQQIVEAGTTIGYTVTGQDIYGNPITSGWTMTVSPMTGVTIDTNAQTITFTRSGSYNVRATYLTVYDQKTVTVTDHTPPTLVWTQPARGTFTQAPTVTLRGTVADVGGTVASLTINDFDVPLVNNQFYLMQSLNLGLNIFEAEVADSAGNSAFYALSVLRGNYLANDAWVTDAVGVKVTEAGFDRVETIAEYVLGQMFDLEQLIYDTLQIHDVYDLGFIVCSVDIVATDVALDPIQLTLDALNGYINAIVLLNNLDIDIQADITCEFATGEKVTYTGSVTADWIKAEAPVYAGLNGSDLEITIGTVIITQQDLAINISGIDPVLLALLVQDLWPLLQSMANQIIQEEIPPILDDLLSDLELIFSFELLNHTLTMEAEFAALDVTDSGLLLWMDAQTTADSYDPNTPPHPGSYYTQGTLPQFGALTPGGQVYELGAGLVDNILNQMLYVIYRSGMITFDLDEETAQLFGFTFDLTAGDLELFFPGISEIAGPDAPVVIQLRPKLPPILDLSPAKDVTIQMEMGEFFLNLAVEPEVGDPVIALAMVMALRAPVTVQPNEAGNAIQFDIGSPDISLDVLSSMFLLPDAFLEIFMPALVDLLLPLIAQFLEEFPIPVFEGFSLNIEELTTIGQQNNYLGVFGTLVIVPPELSMAADEYPWLAGW